MERRSPGRGPRRRPRRSRPERRPCPPRSRSAAGVEAPLARSRAPEGRGGSRSSPAPRDSFTLLQVARAVGGRVSGDGRRRLTGVAPLESAGPSDLSFVADERRAGAAAASGAGAVLAPSEALAGGK